MDVTEQLARVDAATVTAVARQAIGSPAARVVRWEHQVAYGGYGVVRGTNCLLRISGSATDGGRPAPWSAYLKLTRVPPVDALGAHDLTHNEYWRREIATYESEIPAQLPDGMTTPRCYAVVDAGDCVHLWLENVQEEGAAWPLPRYGLAGRHLGRFNGQYLAGRAVPAYPWLNRGFLRARADRNAPFWAKLDELRTHPLFGVMFPGDAADRSRALFADRHALLDALDRLPQTLVHQDADRRNLLGRDGAAGLSETVAIDWAFTGLAAVGTDAAALAVSSVLWAKGVGPEDLPALDVHVFEGYLAGLRDAGWDGDAGLARLGYAATVALRYGPLLGINTQIEADEQQKAALTQTLGHPFEEAMARYGRMLPHVLDRADEARGLLAAMS
jgi:hypothetical protein